VDKNSGGFAITSRMSDSTKETQPVDNLCDYCLPKDSVAYNYTETTGTISMDGSDDSAQGSPL
jgi:hypothetical protein